MHISLTPRLESYVKSKITSGLYNNASEVIREALRHDMEKEPSFDPEYIAWVNDQLQVAEDQLEAGDGIPWDPVAFSERRSQRRAKRLAETGRAMPERDEDRD